VRAGEQTYLLNKSTGETKIISGTTLVTVKSPDLSLDGEPFKKAKSWPDSSINDLPDVKFRLRTKYRDGAMLWAIEASPFQGALEQSYKAASTDKMRQPTVLFELYDDDGFRIGDAIELKIKDGSRTVNEKNEVLLLSWSGTQPMSSESYRSAAFASTRWFGFGKD
jgi:hypothetical protein